MPIDYYDEGLLAAANGMSSDHNPYEEGTDAHERWLVGFLHFRGVDEDGEVKDEAH